MHINQLGNKNSKNSLADSFLQWQLQETEFLQLSQDQAYRSIFNKMKKDISLEQEKVVNLTESITECKDDIQLLVSNGNDPTKIRQSLLNLQQKMRSRTKEHGRAKAKLERLLSGCQKNVDSLTVEIKHSKNSKIAMNVVGGKSCFEMEQAIPKWVMQVI